MSKASSARRRKKKKRRAARRKAKKRAAAPKGRRAQLRASGDWKLHECLVAQEWREEGALVQMLVSRRSPTGRVAIGAFLVDMGCLGVKAAFGKILDSVTEYKNVRRDMTGRQKMVKVDPNLAAKIVREAIDYAKDLGFRPDPDYRDAMLVLGDADPDACDEVIPLGKDGKPFFAPGPDDKVNLIMAKLTRKLGPDGFLYMIPVDGDGE